MDSVETQVFAKKASPEAQKSPAPGSETPGELSRFVARHIGPNDEEVSAMLAAVGFENLDTFIDATVPTDIRLTNPLDLPAGKSEQEALAELRQIAQQNKVVRNFIGAGYSDCVVPPVIQRNILENPGLVHRLHSVPGRDRAGPPRSAAQFSDDDDRPDRARYRKCLAARRSDRRGGGDDALSCGRRRARHVFRLGNVPSANDRGRANARPAVRHPGHSRQPRNFSTSPTRSSAFSSSIPTTDGAIIDYEPFIKSAHAAGALAIVAADILALTLVRPPGEMGADVAVGSSQRFGVPMGCGGPHAAYFATRDQYKRQLPGRLVGVSHDAAGRPAYRLALQTREQHIRRDKATSNICTAQVLLAVMASMYAVYHGPEGLRRIARRVHDLTCRLAEGLEQLGLRPRPRGFFRHDSGGSGETRQRRIPAPRHCKKLQPARPRPYSIGISLDETTTPDDIEILLDIFGESSNRASAERPRRIANRKSQIANPISSPIPVFNTHDSETEMLRYMRRLEARDLSLCHSMIPLGSCTMKLNATAEMFPISWPEFARLHPFAPDDQTAGYHEMCDSSNAGWRRSPVLPRFPCSRTPDRRANMPACSPSALTTRRAAKRDRNVCLIPTSAHGTNPASAVMAGFKVVPVRC